MNLRKDHYRLASSRWHGAGAAPPRSSPDEPSRGSPASPPRRRRVFPRPGAQVRLRRPTPTNPPSLGLVPTGHPPSLPRTPPGSLLPPCDASRRGPAPRADGPGPRGRARGRRRARCGGGGASVRCLRARPAIRNLDPSAVAAASPWPSAARLRVPAVAQSLLPGPRRRLRPLRGGRRERPGVRFSPLYPLRLLKRWPPTKLETQTVTTLSGGSLGSCVDEERS